MISPRKLWLLVTVSRVALTVPPPPVAGGYIAGIWPHEWLSSWP